MVSALLVLTNCVDAPIVPVQSIRALPSAIFNLDSPALDDIRDVEWVADSTFVVIAGGAKIGVVKGGVSITFLGRKGAGPGEFQNISSILRWGPDSFLVVDSGNRRLLFWSTDGRLLSELALADDRLSYGPFLTRDGGVLKVFPSGGKIARLLVISGPSEHPRARLDSSHGIAASCALCNTSIGPDGSIAFAEDPKAYRVQRIDAHDRTIAPIVREHYPLITRSPYEVDSVRAFRRAFRDQMRASGLSDANIRELLATLPVATSKSMFVPGGIHHDDSGDLWLQRNVARGAPSEVDVFSPDGVQRGTVLLPPGFLVSRLRGQFVLGLQATDIGGTSIVVLTKPTFAN